MVSQGNMGYWPGSEFGGRMGTAVQMPPVDSQLLFAATSSPRVNYESSRRSVVQAWRLQLLFQTPTSWHSRHSSESLSKNTQLFHIAP